MKLVLSRRLTLSQVLPYILIVGSVVGLVCSFILSQDAMQLAQNANSALTCNLNPVISCGSVMKANESEVFGFPNSWIGLVTFAATLTVGVALLAEAQFKRWFWLAFELGVGAGVVFAYWLFFVSMYAIQALCPFCLTVDVVLTTMFWYLSLHVLGKVYLHLPRRAALMVTFARRHHLEILVTWFLLVLALILQHFWYFYGQFI